MSSITRSFECSSLRHVALLAACLIALGGCSTLTRGKREAAPPPEPVEQAPLSTTLFELPDGGTTIVGEVQVMRARAKDTFIDIAQAYDLGYDELVEANPGIDPWLPGEGTRIVLPSRFVLPDAPRTGIVLNVASKRLFYYPKAEKGARPVVHTFPISIGREGWATPVGTTKVVSKRKDPVWRVPASIRKEHAENGDPLPAVVPPGPDNPLGRYAMRLAIPGDYLIHGTNKPAGVGMRVSHGCIRMNPEDIEWLFPKVALGLPVHIVNQPLLVGVERGWLYVEAHPALEEDKARHTAALLKDLEKRVSKAGVSPNLIDYDRVGRISTDRRGLPVSVMVDGRDLDTEIAGARLVTNTVTYEWFSDGEAEAAAEAAKPAAGAVGPDQPVSQSR